jgi:cysteine synthase
MKAQHVGQLIGNTPLVRINQLTGNCKAEVFAKLEYYNPASSVKDRIAWGMVEDAEKRGEMNVDSLIIEPSSGNTGIGLAMVCAIKGYRLMVVMPENMSVERRKILEGFGAKVVLTPASLGMSGSISEADRLSQTLPNAVQLKQFENPANPRTHETTTAQEIWKDTEGKIDIIVAGVGTGGTISGVGKALKALNPGIKLIAVEPASSPVLSGGVAAPHKIQGIGAGFVPQNFNRSIIDEIITVTNEEAITTAQLLMRKEGIFAGISSGANAFAAIKVAERAGSAGKRIVFFACDTAERYLSTDLFTF